MKKYKPLIIIVLVALCSLGIVLLHRKKENDKLARYEQIREACKKEISNIHDMESEDYIKKIDVTLNYKIKDAYPGARAKMFNDQTTLIVRFDEAFGELAPKERALKLIEYDEVIRANMADYQSRAGHDDFMKRYGIRDSYFEVNGVKYYVDNYYSIEYYCDSDEYVLFTYSMNIENHKNGNKEIYNFSYENGKLERFEKYESPKKKETTKTTESSNSVTRKSTTKKSSSKKTTEKSHDPDEYDIDAYYDDYKDEFEDEDDAWQDFEDNEMWDDY